MPRTARAETSWKTPAPATVRLPRRHRGPAPAPTAEARRDAAPDPWLPDPRSFVAQSLLSGHGAGAEGKATNEEDGHAPPRRGGWQKKKKKKKTKGMGDADGEPVAAVADVAAVVDGTATVGSELHETKNRATRRQRRAHDGDAGGSESGVTARKSRRR